MFILLPSSSLRRNDRDGSRRFCHLSGVLDKDYLRGKVAMMVPIDDILADSEEFELREARRARIAEEATKRSESEQDLPPVTFEWDGSS